MARNDRYIGQTYGPAGMGMNAYMDRPGPQRRSNVRDLGQTYGPAGMGMNAYMNRPEQQQRGIPPSKRFGQGMPSPGRRFENYLNRGMGRGIDSLGPNIGRDRHPTTMDPIMTMLDNPQVMRDWQDKRKLEEQMDPDNFLTNRIAVGEQFNVDPFGDINTYPHEETHGLGDINTYPHEETHGRGIMGAMPEERQMAEISGKQGDWMGGEYGNPEHYSRSPSGFEDYKSNVEAREDTGSWIPWRAAQEPATDQEIRDRLKDMIQNKQWGGNTPTLGNFKQWGIV